MYQVENLYRVVGVLMFFIQGEEGVGDIGRCLGLGVLVMGCVCVCVCVCVWCLLCLSDIVDDCLCVLPCGLLFIIYDSILYFFLSIIIVHSYYCCDR